MHLYSNSFLYTKAKLFFSIKTFRKISDLFRFHPYSFTSIAAIFDLHLHHLQRLLHRMSFTEVEYKNRSIPLKWSSLKRLILMTTFNWTVILLLFLVVALSPLSPANLLTGFALIFSRAFDVAWPEVEIFAFTYAGTFLLSEDASLYSLYHQQKYQNTKLELIYEFRANLDSQLSKAEIKMLTEYFARYSFLARVCCKGVTLGTFLLILRLFITSIEMYKSTERITTFQVALGFGLSAAANLILCQILHLIFTLLTGLFFIVKILKTKFGTALKILDRLETAKSCKIGDTRVFFSRFHAQYLAVHRHVLWYNEMVREYILDFELCSKVFTSVLLIFMLKRGLVNVFLCLFLVFYLVIYLYNINNQIRLSYFQTANEAVYKKLTTISGKMAVINESKQKFKVNRKQLRFRFKLNQVVEFASQNRFGFTMGRAYLLNQNRVIESCVLNVYILVLISEKLDL